MFDENVKTTKMQKSLDKDLYYDNLKAERVQRALRFSDMQQVVNARLMASQQSVDNAQNYPSTWSTNPDGGANGQV